MVRSFLLYAQSTLEHFHHPIRNSLSIKQSLPIPLPPGGCPSTFCLWGLPVPDIPAFCIWLLPLGVMFQAHPCCNGVNGTAILGPVTGEMFLLVLCVVKWSKAKVITPSRSWRTSWPLMSQSWTVSYRSHWSRGYWVLDLFARPARGAL